MSVSSLLDPSVQNQNWSSLFANSIDVTNLTLQNINVQGGGPLIVDGLTDNGNMSVAGSCLIGPNDLQVSNGTGLNGQLLATNGNGVTTWVTGATGNVDGPVSSVASNICTFADATGHLIQDSGVSINNVVVNPMLATLEANNQQINNLQDIVLTDQGVISLPSVVNSNKIISSSADHKLYKVSNLGASNPIALENASNTFSSVTFDGKVASPTVVNYNYDNVNKFVQNTGLTSFDINDSSSNNYLHIDSSVPLVALGSNANPVVSLYSNNVTMGLGANGFEIDATSYNSANVGHVLTQSASAGIVNWEIPSRTLTLEYSGTIAVTNYFNAIGNPTNAGQAAQSPLTDETVAVNSKISVFSYNTTSGDGTSQLQVYKNGVGQGLFLLSSVSGVISLNISCVAGDLIAIRQEAGTAIGLCNVALSLFS